MSGQSELLGRLRQAVELSGLSHNEVAERAGTAQPVISRYLRAGSTTWPSGEILMRLPAVLGISGHWLLTGEGPMEPPGADVVAIYERGREQGWVESMRTLRETHERITAIARPSNAVPPVALDMADEELTERTARQGTPDRRSGEDRRQG